jgi:opacity protein-like surface antigen
MMRQTVYRAFAARRAARAPWLVLALLSLGCFAAPADAHAQGFISPLIGFDFGGDSGCPTASDCEDKNSNIGVAFGSLGAVGYEGELSYARNFFGETPGTSSNVLTFMNNLMIAPKIGAVRPYVLIGVGLIKTRVEFTVPSLLELDNNSFGWDFGGGLMVFFGDHIGIRGDLRKFKSFQTDDAIPFLPFGDEKLGFNRAAAAVVFAF